MSQGSSLFCVSRATGRQCCKRVRLPTTRLEHTGPDSDPVCPTCDFKEPWQQAILPQVLTEYCSLHSLKGRWEQIPMGIGVIPIPMEVDSHSRPFPFQFSPVIPIPMGFPWDSHWERERDSHAHLYFEPLSFRYFNTNLQIL